MAKIVYAKSGDKLVKKWRCTSGKRKGKLVSEPKSCFKPIDIKKKIRMKRIRKQKGPSIERKTKLTKTKSPVSKQVARMNKIINRSLKDD